MRDPRRWRNIQLAIVASGLALMALYIAMPRAQVHDTWLGILLLIYWPNAILFGGGMALLSHLTVRAQEGLRSGRDVLARWRIDPGAWRAFAAAEEKLNSRSGALLNELSLDIEVPAEGIDVLVGKNAVQVGDSVHWLPRRGTPEITRAGLEISRFNPSYIEFQLYYPPAARTSARNAVLRFPVTISALPEAERVVAEYEAGRPGRPDFFHGAGDGSNPEDVSTCYGCGYATHKFVSFCPQCGQGMQTKRWSRRFGWTLTVCGLFITVLMGGVLFYTVPLMLRPGVTIGGTRFSGSAWQAVFALAIMGTVFVFGLLALGYGLFQVKTGRRSRTVIRIVVTIGIVLYLVALGIDFLW